MGSGRLSVWLPLQLLSHSLGHAAWICLVLQDQNLTKHRGSRHSGTMFFLIDSLRINLFPARLLFSKWEFFKMEEKAGSFFPTAFPISRVQVLSRLTGATCSTISCCFHWLDLHVKGSMALQLWCPPAAWQRASCWVFPCPAPVVSDAAGFGIWNIFINMYMYNLYNAQTCLNQKIRTYI